MATFGSIAYTAEVQAAQRRLGSPLARFQDAGAAPATDLEPAYLGSEERQFIEARDGFFQATVSSTGWPYVQFRGGPPGFVQVLDPQTIGYADLRGNRQYISTGNLAGDDRVSLFFMDWADRARLKLLGRARIIDDPADERLRALAAHADRGMVERAVIITVAATDWNCRQHIPPRWTRAEIDAEVRPLLDRIADLERQLDGLRPS